LKKHPRIQVHFTPTGSSIALGKIDPPVLG
jgi:hypothetical protein